MINFDEVLMQVGKFGAMKFFSADPIARIAIAEQLCEMAHTIEQIDWVINRTIKLHSTGWPGIGEVRAVFCSKFKPRDGIEANSTVYVDGIPSEREERSLLAAAEAPKQIKGRTEDPAFSSVFALLAEASANRSRNRLQHVKAAAQAEIEAIKAQQERNRKEQPAVVLSARNSQNSNMPVVDGVIQ